MLQVHRDLKKEYRLLFWCFSFKFKFLLITIISKCKFIRKTPQLGTVLLPTHHPGKCNQKSDCIICNLKPLLSVLLCKVKHSLL